MDASNTPNIGLKLMTAWICPPEGLGLPRATQALEGVLDSFYEAFPEYTDTLVFSQAPRFPFDAFVYVNEGCNGLLSGAGSHLCGLLKQAFPEAEIKPYGKRIW